MVVLLITRVDARARAGGQGAYRVPADAPRWRPDRGGARGATLDPQAERRRGRGRALARSRPRRDRRPRRRERRRRRRRGGRRRRRLGRRGRGRRRRDGHHRHPHQRRRLVGRLGLRRIPGAVRHGSGRSGGRLGRQLGQRDRWRHHRRLGARRLGGRSVVRVDDDVDRRGGGRRCGHDGRQVGRGRGRELDLDGRRARRGDAHHRGERAGRLHRARGAGREESGIAGAGGGVAADARSRRTRSTKDFPLASSRVKRISSPAGCAPSAAGRCVTTLPSPRKSAVPSRSAISNRTMSPGGRGPAPISTMPPRLMPCPSPATNSSPLAYGRFRRNATGGGEEGLVTTR